MNAQICPIAIEKILLSINGSESSEGAIRESIYFARRCSSKLIAMSVIESNPEYESISSESFSKKVTEVKKNLENVKARAEKEGVDCDIRITRGIEPHYEIVNDAVKRHVDMIVVGRRGARGFKRLIVGEVAAKIIRGAPCKVLVVPRAAKIEWKTILIATDGSAHSKSAATEAVTIAKKCGSNLIVVSSIRSDDELEEAKANVKKVADLAEKTGIPVETLTPKGRSYDVVIETAGGRRVDLIVVGSYGKTGVRKLFMGNSTEKIINNSGCAVLVVRAQ
jgi:nucleotide-binding universal stress UspA family protein